MPIRSICRRQVKPKIDYEDDDEDEDDDDDDDDEDEDDDEDDLLQQVIYAHELISPGGKIIEQLAEALMEFIRAVRA